MLETDLYALLSTDAPLLQAMNDRNNVYLGMVPKGQTDVLAVVMQVTHAQYFKAYDVTNNLTMKRLQVDSYAARYSDALALSNIVRDLLKDMSGALATVTITGVILSRDMDMGYEPGQGGEIFRRLLEFDIWHVDGFM